MGFGALYLFFLFFFLGIVALVYEQRDIAVWVHRVDERLLQEIIILKSEKYIFKSVGKLLIILHIIYNESHYTNLFREYYSVLLRALFGGNYTSVVKDAVIAGYVLYERGKPPELTQEGQAVARVLVDAWEQIKQKEKQKE